MSASRFHRTCAALGVCQAREPACTLQCLQRSCSADINLNAAGVLQRVDTSQMAHDDGVSVGGLCTPYLCEGHPSCAETHCDNHPDNPGDPEANEWAGAVLSITKGTWCVIALLVLVLIVWPWLLYLA